MLAEGECKMTVSDVSTLINNAASNFNGLETVVNQDLSNILDFGRAVEDAMGYDVFFGKLVDQFNTIKFWSRPYVSFAPSVYVEAERFGSIRAMYRTGYLPSQASPVYNLVDGQSYDPNVVSKQTVQSRFWSKRFSSMVKPQTIVREQIESAFRSETELMSFIGMLEMARNNSHARAWDELIMSLFQGIIGLAVNSGGMQDIKLLTEYNSQFGTSLTASQAIYNQEFIRYAIYRMGVIRDQMKLVTGIFNASGIETATNDERQKTVMISDFARAAGVYLHDAPNQFNTGNLSVPNADIVPAWQGLGNTADFATRAAINATIDLGGEETVTSTAQYVVGVVYDEWALGVSAHRHEVTTNYNPLGHFTNYFDQMFGGYFVSPDENVVVFRLV